MAGRVVFMVIVRKRGLTDACQGIRSPLRGEFPQPLRRFPKNVEAITGATVTGVTILRPGLQIMLRKKWFGDGAGIDFR